MKNEVLEVCMLVLATGAFAAIAIVLFNLAYQFLTAMKLVQTAPEPGAVEVEPSPLLNQPREVHHVLAPGRQPLLHRQMRPWEMHVALTTETTEPIRVELPGEPTEPIWTTAYKSNGRGEEPTPT